jgi:hypothetical protein
MRPRRLFVDPKKPETLVDMIEELTLQEEGRISYGSPQNPEDLADTTLAGSAAGAHAGTLENMEGSWVELDVETADWPTTCYHNLNTPVAVAGSPNVRWLVFGYQHDGNTADVASTVSCSFEVGDIVAVNSIELRFYVGGTRVVNKDHPLKVTLFFIRAIR